MTDSTTRPPPEDDPLGDHIDLVQDPPIEYGISRAYLDSTTRPPRTPTGQRLLRLNIEKKWLLESDYADAIAAIEAEAAAPDAGLRQADVAAALDRAWLASGDAQGAQRPPDLAGHLFAALAAHRSSDPSPDRCVDCGRKHSASSHGAAPAGPAVECPSCDDSWAAHVAGLHKEGPDGYKVGSDDPE